MGVNDTRMIILFYDRIGTIIAQFTPFMKII